MPNKRASRADIPRFSEKTSEEYLGRKLATTAETRKHPFRLVSLSVGILV